MNGKASGSSRSYILGAAVTFIFILFCRFVSLNEDIASKIDFQAYVSEKNSVPPSQNSVKAAAAIETAPARKIKHFDSQPAEYVFPKKIYMVVGLESSGTNFVAMVLSKALGIESYQHQEVGPYQRKYGPFHKDDVWVQHVSLPTNPRCEKYPNPQALNVLLPGCCRMPARDSKDKEKFRQVCMDWGKDANVPMREDIGFKLPGRYFLDLIKHKEWYDSVGFDQDIIIVVRDQNIARKGRVERKYCQDPVILEREEAFGTDIISRTINKYILNEDVPDRRRLTELPLNTSSFQPWYEENFLNVDFMTDDTNSTVEDARRMLSASTLLPNGNKVYLVSYEQLMKLKGVYVKMMYQALGIESDYMPVICDGNTRYVDDPNGDHSNESTKGKGPGRKVKTC